MDSYTGVELILLEAQGLGLDKSSKPEDRDHHSLGLVLTHSSWVRSDTRQDRTMKIFTSGTLVGELLPVKARVHLASFELDLDKDPCC